MIKCGTLKILQASITRILGSPPWISGVAVHSPLPESTSWKRLRTGAHHCAAFCLELTGIISTCLVVNNLTSHLNWARYVKEEDKENEKAAGLPRKELASL